MRAAYFHEDDYCQIEAVSDENLDWCVDQSRRIDEFSSAHRNGDAYTEMYVRLPNPVELMTKSISIEEISQVLTPYLQPYDVVRTGYSTYVETLSGTLAFGNEPAIIVFAEHRDRLISAIWFTLQPSDEEQIEIATAALRTLAKWSLIFVDWGWSRVIHLNDDDAIREYLRERAEVFAELQAQFERDRSERKASEPAQSESWFTRIRNWIRRRSKGA